jgi:protein required for attachment to host cells
MLTPRNIVERETNGRRQMKTWIVVAHRGGARLLEQEGDDKPSVFETIDNPAGRSGQGEPSAPGQPTDSQRGGRAPEPPKSGRERAARTFAGELADKLQRGRIGKRYGELFLIAAPRFLGVLRHALDPATSALVRGTLDKDYAGLSDHELIERLEAM